MIYIKDHHTTNSFKCAVLIAFVVIVTVLQRPRNNKIFWYHNVAVNSLIKNPRPIYKFVLKLFQPPKLNITEPTKLSQGYEFHKNINIVQKCSQNYSYFLISLQTFFPLNLVRFITDASCSILKIESNNIQDPNCWRIKNKD